MSGYARSAQTALSSVSSGPLHITHSAAPIQSWPAADNAVWRASAAIIAALPRL
jgi:hypothetical protein